MEFAVDRRKYYQRSQDHNSHEKSLTGTKRNSQYFCDHCKISGHSIDHCFKIHGYPSPSRRASHKKIAAVTHGDPSSSFDIKDTGLTKEQFTHLLNLLNKKDVDKPTDLDVTASTGTLAGPYNEEAFTSW
ncbi:unnamed protein product [Amaranthus hypochondriacus]